jgi:alpha-beta hydrolase superfamily lysophospholipase
MRAVEQQKVHASRIVRIFSGNRQDALGGSDAAISDEDRAALRQFSLERLMAYGVHHADAMELRGRVSTGEPWQPVAAELAEVCLAPPEGALSVSTDATLANQLYRASALHRVSQLMMIEDTPERQTILSRAADLYHDAAELTKDRKRLQIDTAGGPLVGWLFPSRVAHTVGRAVVIGGVEGWAMDFDALGIALAERGVEALMLDGPGQGESRLVHGHYLTANWERAYDEVFKVMASRNEGRGIAMIGNSMGGALAMHLAARNPHIITCCSNGGPKSLQAPWTPTTFYRKMAAHCGPASTAQAEAVWRTIMPADPVSPVRCPLLIVQGGMDPLVRNEDADWLFERAESEDKALVTFSDGDHCIYNHSDDKHALIGDWVAERLSC